MGSGRALVQGFIDGIWSARDAAGEAVSGVLGWVSGFFPNSPAKRGPFSGSGWTRVYDGGGALTAQFAAGMRDAQIGAPVAAAVGMVGQIGTPTAAASETRVQVDVHGSSDPVETGQVAANTVARLLGKRGG